MNDISALADACGLTKTAASILYGRGVDTPEKTEVYINASREHFISPYKMRGMKEAVELIKRARDEEWDVLVYGDYDADGICAAVIMGGALKDFGLNVNVYVPERRNGYGLTAASIDGIFEDYFPQLFITVDCGICNADEVEYLKESGCEVIVTDHHELPDRIPDCICINPKFEDSYPYDNLCGAGVALKVACALCGDAAYKYLDFAALATIADSVPLTGENRDIVAEGLKLVNKSPRKCFSELMVKMPEKFCSHTLAFGIAPKVNAAGRMGDAASALKLFFETDDDEIAVLAAKLNEYNRERQVKCDELYNQAKSKLSKSGVCGKVIMLCGDDWNSGFVGIVAARLAEEYTRPVILFVKNDGILKGSARSIEGVNIFDALKSASEYIVEFGGHSQAAGVNVTEENFAVLERVLGEYMDANYTADDFIPTLYVSRVFEGDDKARLARELDKFEPYGVGNRRPLFEALAGDCRPMLVKPQSQHLALKCDDLNMLYFGGMKNAELLKTEAVKSIVYEYNVSYFRGKEYIRGFVKDVILTGSCGEQAGDFITANAVMRIINGDGGYNAVKKSIEEIESEIMCRKGYGTLYIAAEYETVLKYKNESLFPADLFNLSSRNLSDCMLIAPAPGCDLSGFRRIVMLDESCGSDYIIDDGAEIIVCSDIEGRQWLDGLDIGREHMLEIFSYISANRSMLVGADSKEVVLLNSTPFSAGEMIFALTVFEQLGLIKFERGRLALVKGVKTELCNSPLYRKIQSLKSAE